VSGSLWRDIGRTVLELRIQCEGPPPLLAAHLLHGPVSGPSFMNKGPANDPFMARNSSTTLNLTASPGDDYSLPADDQRSTQPAADALHRRNGDRCGRLVLPTSSSLTRVSHTLCKDLTESLMRLVPLQSKELTFGQLYYLLLGALAGHKKRVVPQTMRLAGVSNTAQRRKAGVASENIAHAAMARALRLEQELASLFFCECRHSARALKLEISPVGAAVRLKRALRGLMEVDAYREYEVMTKEAFNMLRTPDAAHLRRKLWDAGEREELLQRLCSRGGRTWITEDFFNQHTRKDAGEVYLLIHMPSKEIRALAAVADFQTPWTAGQFHHCSHSCQEDRMFYLGRKSERYFTPKVSIDMSASFEGGTRFTSHFHMPSLFAVDIICAQPTAVRGLAHVLLSHVALLQSSFLSAKTHWLFDISGREENTRMVRFTQEIGALRCQTFADETRSEGYVGVEGDDPSIYWTYKAGGIGSSSTYGDPSLETAGIYAMDRELRTPITTQHPAVLFNDRVTQQDFLRGGKNCSYFAVAPLELSQDKLAGHLVSLRESVQLQAGADKSAIQMPINCKLPWQQDAALSGDRTR